MARRTKYTIHTVADIPQEVEGVKIGEFWAYHKPSGSNMYALTHLPTGARAGVYSKVSGAKLAAATLSELVFGAQIVSDSIDALNAVIEARLAPDSDLKKFIFEVCPWSDGAEDFATWKAKQSN